jgi:endonuclease III
VNGEKPPAPRTVTAVAKSLEKSYGSPRHGNPADPLDDLIYILLSNRTAPTVASEIYHKLRSTVARWDEIDRVPLRVLRRILTPAGLASKRAAYIRALVKQIRSDFGEASLSALREMTDEDVEAYLVTLPGVSTKVAKCVMMYALNREVLPVDVHVHRITQRLGWHRHRRADQSHGTLDALVPPDSDTGSM